METSRADRSRFKQPIGPGILPQSNQAFRVQTDGWSELFADCILKRFRRSWLECFAANGRTPRPTATSTPPLITQYNASVCHLSSCQGGQAQLPQPETSFIWDSSRETGNRFAKCLRNETCSTIAATLIRLHPLSRSGHRPISTSANIAKSAQNGWRTRKI